MERIRTAIDAANQKLDRLDAYTRLIADRAALEHYLFGLPLGVLVLYLLALGLSLLDVTEVDLDTLLVPLVAGGVGR